ncbi:MAG: oxidoreductase [Leeuwenhoekiella sp.]|nr:MAG: oxidoreductase [Leeuwenhoekiella sp.]
MPIIRIDNTNESFEQIEEQDCILRAGLRAGLGLPYECNSGGCGSCKFQILKGEVEELWPEAPGLNERDRQKGRLLACQCRAKSDVIIKMRIDDSYRSIVSPVRMEATLIERSEITPDITKFRMKAPVADFLPGQYAMLSLAGGTGPRAYSMSNTANEEGLWDFWIRKVNGGQFTERLFGDLKEGDKVMLDGPYGLAHLQPEAPRDVLCIAGGSGISPMLSVARGVLTDSRMAGRHVHFFFGGRTPLDICGYSELCQLPDHKSRIHYHAAISDLKASNAWSGHIGFIHEVVDVVLGNKLEDYECYVAGPPPMVNASTNMLRDRGVPAAQIHFDRFF